MTSPLFDQIQATLDGTPNRRGWYDADCPNCGKPAAKGQTHFGYNEEGAAHCFVCGWKGDLRDVAALLRMEIGEYVPIERKPKPAPPVARWRMNPSELLRRYKTHPARLATWQGYKPLTLATLDKYGFGLGRMPFLDDYDQWYMSRSEWLTVPLYEDGQLVGLRGRNLSDNGPKWISANGTNYALWNVENVRAGSVCWLCENYVDAAWLMQTHPDYCAVAIGGATTWRREWADRLYMRNPGLVVVALDNDLPGQAVGPLRAKLVAEWREEHGTEPPEANGPKIANALLSAGLKSVLFRWPENAPVKAGIDWAIEQSERMEEVA